MWNVADVVCSGGRKLGMCDVGDVRCSGCGMFGMFGMWNIEDVGYSGCGMFQKWDMGCGKFAGMWDVDLQNAGKMA